MCVPQHTESQYLTHLICVMNDNPPTPAAIGVTQSIIPPTTTTNIGTIEQNQSHQLYKIQQIKLRLDIQQLQQMRQAYGKPEQQQQLQQQQQPHNCNTYNNYNKYT